MKRLAISCTASAMLISAAAAQPGQTPAQPARATPPSTPAPATDAASTSAPVEAAPEETEEEIDPIAKAEELQNKVDALEARLNAADEARKARFPIRITGYGDVGFFTTQGDGAGFRRDIGHTAFPEHSNIGWVFYGDLLATPVNTRGDVADLGEAPGVDRFDSVNSEGNPTFLVNELNVGVHAGLGSSALFTSSINFTPRSGTDFRLGDSFDVDIVQLEWQPTDDGKTSIFVGKVDSVIGIEYKSRKAQQRFGITPSLLARYTTGTAIGIKARTILLDDHIVLAAAVTNGSFGTEQFHFFNEIDSNAYKTMSGRAAVRFKVGDGAFEAGPSVSYGRQDGASNEGGKMWFVGVDAELATTRYALRAQWLRGKAPGDEMTMAYSLDLKNGGYVEGNLMATPRIGILARAEFRDAEVQEVMERLYITKNWRATAGVRLVFNPHASIKAEYSHNGEYGGMPSIPDDVVTTSAVMAF